MSRMRDIRQFARGVLHAAKLCAAGLDDLFLPAVCGACGSTEVASDCLCGQCAVALLSMVSLPYCVRCGATIGPNIPISQDGCSVCPTTLPRFESVVRLGPYAQPIRGAIHELKYRKREAMLRRLGQLLAEAVSARASCTLDVAVPVPMHWRRRLVKGYDHARAIGRQIARELHLPLGDELIRVRYTPPQVRLPRTKRIENVRGAFGMRSPVAIQGAHVLLVDDVTTTGATANEATRVLLAGGASKVILAVVAKAEPPRAYATHWG